MQMNASMGKHLQFLTQMAMDSTTMKLLYRNINKHYMQVEILVKQMAAEIDRQKNKDGQQEILSIAIWVRNCKCIPIEAFICICVFLSYTKFSPGLCNK